MEVVVIWLLVFYFGASVGSFLNVAIDRMPGHISITKGRSFCDHCKKTLRWWELFPIFSYFLLGGKCVRCHKKLSKEYVIVETITGLITLGVFLRYSPTLIQASLNFSETPFISAQLFVQILSLLFFVYGLIVITGIDWKLQIIPDRVNLFLVFIFASQVTLNFLFEFLAYGQVDIISQLADQVLTPAAFATIIAGFFYFLIVVTKGKGMGGGDVKLAFTMGLFLSPKLLFLAVYMSFIIGGIVAVALLLLKKKKFGQNIAFGPFLALGSLIALLYGDELILFYLTHSS